MSFRLTFRTQGPGQNRYGSDRHASAEWRHCIAFPARCFAEAETDLAEESGQWRVLEAAEASLVLVIEPQHSERVLPSVFIYPDKEGGVARIEALVHVPVSFGAALEAGQSVVAEISFRQSPRDLFDMSGGDRLGQRCAIAEGGNVVVELVGSD